LRFAVEASRTGVDTAPADRYSRRTALIALGSCAVVKPGDASAEFFFREPSFSLIYFPDAARDAIPALLIRCGYSIIGEAQYQAPFPDLVAVADIVEGPRNSIVRKAVYAISGGSVLLDPEMVVGLNHADVVAGFCTEHRADAFVAVWERVSETVLARHIAAGGVLADVLLIRGVPQGNPLDPPPGIIREPGPASLKAFLAAAGAPLGEMFGQVSARLFKLDESAMFP
jgi:hypothetical protein